MIIEFYPNPNKKAPPPVVLGNSPTGYLEMQANKMGCTFAEYAARDDAVRKESNRCSYQIGDEVFPFSKKAYEEKGKCRIINIARRYVDLGKDYTWEDNKPIFVVTAKAEKNDFCTFLATAGFFQKTEPTE